MKKSIILLAILASFGAMAQDTLLVVPPSPDTTKIKISIKTVANTQATITQSIYKTVQPQQQPPVTPVDSSVTSVRKNLILDAPFESSSDFNLFSLSGHQFCCDYSIVQKANPDGIGRGLWYDLKRTDPIVSSSVRAEIELKTSAPETSEYWYGLKYYFVKCDADDGRESVLQWHDVDGTTPPLSLQIGSGQFTVMQSFTTGNIPYNIGNVETGRWIPFVFHVKWTTATTGVLEVWKDGVKVVNKSKIRTNSKGGSYMKIGINKWSWAPGGGTSTTSERIFVIDEFRIGNANATYDDVKPSM